MEQLCTHGMFQCVFDAVFGFGLAVICLLFLAGFLGFFDRGQP